MVGVSRLSDIFASDGTTKIGEIVGSVNVPPSSFGIAMTVMSLLGTFIIGFSMLPQTIMTLKIKQTSGLSLAFYSISGFACLLLTIYGIALTTVPWQGSNGYELQVLDQVGGIKFNDVASGAKASVTVDGTTLAGKDLSLFNVLTLLEIKGASLSTPESLQSILNVKTAGSGNVELAKVVKDAGVNVAMSFTLPGAAVIFGEALVTVTSFLISYQKFANMRAAKKAGISEAEYEKRFQNLNVKGSL